jgi:hypothetical protein
MKSFYPDCVLHAIGREGSVPGQTTMHCENCDTGTGFSPNISVLPCQFSFHQCSIFIHPSSGGWTKDPLEATVPQRHRLTPPREYKKPGWQLSITIDFLYSNVAYTRVLLNFLAVGYIYIHSPYT